MRSVCSVGAGDKSIQTATSLAAHAAGALARKLTPPAPPRPRRRPRRRCTACTTAGSSSSCRPRCARTLPSRPTRRSIHSGRRTPPTWPSARLLCGFGGWEGIAVVCSSPSARVAAASPAPRLFPVTSPVPPRPGPPAPLTRAHPEAVHVDPLGGAPLLLGGCGGLGSTAYRMPRRARGVHLHSRRVGRRQALGATVLPDPRPSRAPGTHPLERGAARVEAERVGLAAGREAVEQEHVAWEGGGRR
jgi:hypothetical protein